MRRGDGDDDARLADLDAAEPVVDRDRGQTVALGQLGAEPREHLLRHLLVRLVVEMEDVAVAGAAAHRPDEARDRAGVGRLDLAQHRGDVERLRRRAERSRR